MPAHKRAVVALVSLTLLAVALTVAIAAMSGRTPLVGHSRRGWSSLLLVSRRRGRSDTQGSPKGQRLKRPSSGP